MLTSHAPYRDQFLEELDRIPEEHLPAVLKVVQTFRESVTLPSAEESFHRAWGKARRGETRPLSELWEGLDAD